MFAPKRPPGLHIRFLQPTADGAKLHSDVDRGGDEKPTQAYHGYVEERDEKTTKVCG